MKLISDYVVALKFEIKTLHMLKGFDNLNRQCLNRQIYFANAFQPNMRIRC